MRRVVRIALLFVMLVVVGWAQPQPLPVVLNAEIINGITTQATVLDNRSATLRNTQHTFCATGSGSWSVQIQYSDTVAAGPWANFSGTLSSVSNSSSDCAGIGKGYHPFIRFTFTGTATVGYAGTKNIYFPLGGGGGGGGPVNSVSGSGPIQSTGGSTPVISCPNCGTGGPFTTGQLVVGASGQGLGLGNLSGDAQTTGSTAVTNLKVNGVVYPANPSTNTLPVVTAPNTITYELVPNASIANPQITVSTTSPLAGGGAVVLGGTITLNCAICTQNPSAATLNFLMLGGGGQQISPMASAGSANTVLHGGTPPTWSAIVNADITNATINLTTKVTAILPGANGGTNNGFVQLAGPTTSLKTWTGPNANANLLTDNACVTVSQGGTGACGGLSGVILGNGMSAYSAAALDGNAAHFLNGAGAFIAPLGIWTPVGADIVNPNSGNVGIGGAPGAFKLDVNGTGRFQQSITINSYSDVSEISPPPAPPPGVERVYAKINSYCAKDSGGTERCVGTGGGGSTTATSIQSALSVTDTGSVNAYAGCDANSTAPIDGLVVILKPLNDNTAGSTYNHCTSGNKPIQTAYGAAMQAGAIRADGAASPSGVIMRYSTAANGAAGAWENLTPGQVQLAVQTTASYGGFPRADGAGLTAWAQPLNPGDGRRTSLAECNGVSGDLTNTALIGAYFTVGSGVGGITSSASTGAGTQFPGCTATTGATSGNNVYFNLSGDSKIFKTGRNLQFDTTIALSSTANTRNWIGLSACSASTDAGTATPCSTGFLGFRYDTGASDTSWRCIVATGSATNVDSSVTTTTNQVHLKFIADDTNNAVHFYIDGSEVCAATAVTNYPPATFLTFHITETTLTTATKGVTMAYQWIQGDK